MPIRGELIEWRPCPERAIWDDPRDDRNFLRSQPIWMIQGFSSIKSHAPDTLSTLPIRPDCRAMRLRCLLRTASCTCALLACESHELYVRAARWTELLVSVLIVSGVRQLTGNTLWMMRIEQELTKLCPMGCGCDSSLDSSGSSGSTVQAVQDESFGLVQGL